MAESLFAARPAAPQASAAVVTVRRSRAPLGEVDAADGEVVQELPAEEKGPRVFRVEAVPTASLAEPAVADVEPSAALPRQRRIATDKRPGPVLQVFSAPAAAGDDGDDGDDDLGLLEAAHPALNAQPRAAVLGDALGELDTVLADIRKARSFRFIGA